MFLDGCQVTKLQNHSTTPLLLAILNYKPFERYHIRKLALSALIPGPRQYKDINSYLAPLVRELLSLAQGVPDISNSYTHQKFALRAHLILVSADGPASASAIGMKTPGNSMRPCHQCLVIPTKSESNRYYITHSRRDFICLNQRNDLRGFIARWDAMPDPVLRREAGTQYGLVKPSILLQLKSLDFPKSFPLDLMHCVLQNLTPQIHTLLGGRQKTEKADANAEIKLRKMFAREHNLDEGAIAAPPQLTALDGYLTTKEWDQIGATQRESRRTIPTSLGQAPRPINVHFNGYKAMEWEAWLVRDGPVLLSNLEPVFNPFLENFLLLRKIYLQSKNWKITPTDVNEIRADCRTFVRTFEELYYRNEPARLKQCKINGHALLHLG